MSQGPECKNKLTPEYWGGYDIFEEDLFKEAPHVPGIYLEHKKFQFARRSLQENVGQVALGNSTEIRYRAGNEFNPELEEGSLVVVDSEHLARWTYGDPERNWEGSRPLEKGPAITRPYSEYWLNNQDGTAQPISIGSETIDFLDELAIYTRLLNWGVVVNQDKDRLIQPFFFNTTKLLPDGYIHTPPALKKDSVLHGQALRMPVSIGEVQVCRRLTLERCAIDALERVRSIDIVYPASGGKEPKRSSRKLGRLALPKLRTSHIVGSTAARYSKRTD